MAYLSRLVKKKLGEILVESGLLREEQVLEALQKQKETGQLLGEVLVNLGYVKEEDIAYALARQFGLPYIDASKYIIRGDYTDLIPVRQMVQDLFIVLDRIGKFLIIAVSGVVDNEFIEDLERKSGCQLFIYVSTASQIMAALQKHYHVGQGTKAAGPK